MKAVCRVGLCIAFLAALSAAAQSTSLLDTNFDVGSGADGVVETVMQQPDGKILICGNFTEYDGTTNSYIARLNDDGSIDTSFNSQVSYWVRTMSLQPDGKIVIGGYFNYVAGQSRNLIARLNSDGSLDTTFDPGSGGSGTLGTGIDGNSDPFVFATAIQSDGKILITGNFTNYNGEVINGICRLNADGTRDTNFDVGPGINFASWGRSLQIEKNSQIMLTGWFTSYNNFSCSRMVLINPDGSPDTSFNPNFGYSSAVYDSLALSDGDYLVVGDTESNVFTSKVARLLPGGAFDKTFVGSDDDKTEAVCLQTNGQILICGYFSTVDGQSRTGIARLNPNGTLDSTFNVAIDNFVWDVATQSDGKILIGGGFSTVDGMSRNGIARLLPSTNYYVQIPPDTNGGGSTNLPPISATNIVVTNADGFVLATNGTGRLLPNLAGRTLNPGQIVVLTAVPARGDIFAGWSGSVTASASALRLTVASNMVVEANFIPDPYPTNAGDYYGIFYQPEDVYPGSSGWMTLAVGAGGGYTARLALNGRAGSCSGKVTPTLLVSNTISLRGQSVRIVLQLGQSNMASGEVSNANFSSPLTCYRLTAGATNFSGIYTALLDGGTNALAAGEGWLSLVANARNGVSIAGMLDDGTPFSQNSVISPDGSIPIYVSYASGNSEAIGWINLTGTNAALPVSGTIYWTKAEAGGTNNAAILQAFGAPYRPPAAGAPVADWTNGMLTVSGDALTVPLSDSFTLRGSARISFAVPNTNRFALTFNTMRGVFAGTFRDPSTGRAAAIHGAVLQPEDFGGGFFVDGGRAGLVTLTNFSASP